VLKGSGRMMWMSEVMNELNMLKFVPPGHVARCEWLNLARVMHAPTGHVTEKGTRREKGKWIGTGHVARYYKLLGFLSS